MLVTEALLVRAAGEALAVPVNAVHVIATLGPSERRITEDGEAALIEDRWLPMVRLDRALGLPEPAAAERLQVLALRAAGACSRAWWTRSSTRKRSSSSRWARSSTAWGRTRGRRSRPTAG